MTVKAATEARRGMADMEVIAVDTVVNTADTRICKVNLPTALVNYE